MSPIHVTTLGRLRIESDGDEVRDLPAQPVRCALLLYLCVERTATRDELLALFWPERDAERARRSLNQTLYELRLQLGDHWLRSSRDRVEITPAVSVDALDFAAAVEAARDQEALAIYGGAFLEGWHLGGTVAFQSWVDRQRSQLSRLHRELCRRLTRSRASRGELEGALEVARRWAEMDPLEDEAHHQIIWLLAETGQRSEALRHYDAYRELIARELEVEPLDETAQLVARIREGGASMPELAERPARESPSGGPAPTGSAPSAAAPDHSELHRGGRGQRAAPVAAAAGRRRAGRWRMGSVVVAVLLGIWLAWQRADRAPGADAGDEHATLDPRGIAVLPFLNLSEDPEKEYFSDGITEDLLTHLSRIRDLRVISRTSVMRYKQTDAPLPQIARELGVRYILEGSVRREDDQVRITAQLIDAASDTHLWAETYDRELTGIFDIQSDIAERIAEQMRHRLLPGERARIAAGGTSQLAAYDLLLRGREYLNRPGAADVRKYVPAMNFFRQALGADPEYARAFVGMSHAFRDHVALPIAVRRDSAVAYARRAVELDPESAEALAALGLANLIAGQRESAERAFQRALELDPNQVEALTGRARLAWIQGRFDQAANWQRRAVAVDPFSYDKLAVLGNFLLDLGDLAGAERAFRQSAALSPDAPATSFMLAQIYLIRSEEQRAEEQMRALEAAASGHPGTHFLLGRFHAQRGRYQAAEAHLARAAQALGRGVNATVSLQRAYVAKKLGQTDRAAELLANAEADLLAREREGAHAPRLRLQLHALRGERDRAVEVLRRQWDREAGGDLLAGPQVGPYWIDRDPLLEDLRDEPAFQTLLDQQRNALDSMRLLLREPGR